MSTPNRPGSRPVPSNEPGEQPRTSARPQPAVRPGTQPQAAGGNRPPVRPPNGSGQAPGRPAPRAENPAAGQSPERPGNGQPARPSASGPKSPERPQVPSAERRPDAPTAAQQPPTEAAPRVEADRPAPPRPDAPRGEVRRPDAPRPDAPRAEDRPIDPLRSGDVGQPATAAFQKPPSGPVRSTPVQNTPVKGPSAQGPSAQGPSAPGSSVQGASVQGNGSTQGAPPWQRGSTPQQGAAEQAPPQQGQNARSPQNQPQTNLSARGGSLPAATPGQAVSAQGAPTQDAPRTAPAGYPEQENPADRTQRRDAAKTKAAGIDGPTRHIERKDLAKDMPDLSEVRHSEPTSETQKVAQPLVVAAREDGEPLRATIQLRKIDPWSTLKISLVIAVSLFFVWMVAVGLLYAVLDGMGVWDRLNSAFTEIVNESGDGGLVSAGQVFGYAAVIGIINMVLFTALTTIGSFIYNLSSDLVGGVEVTLADRD